MKSYTKEETTYVFKVMRKIKINPNIIWNLETWDENYHNKKLLWIETGTPFIIKIDYSKFIIISHYGIKNKFNTHYKELTDLIKAIESISPYYSNIEIFCCFPGIAKKREKEFSKYIKGKTNKIGAFHLLKHKNERILVLSKVITIINRKRK